MEFQTYSKLSSASKQKVINAAVDAGHSGLLYGVSEKIHGANFGIHWGGEDGIQFSRRSAFLAEGEVFYAHTKIEGTLLKRMRKLVTFLQTHGKVDSVSVYGEIYGGGLNGETEVGCKQIQKEVQYSPKTQFAAFDVVVDGKYLPMQSADIILMSAGFHVAPLLGIFSSLEEALKYPNDGQSVVAESLGYEVEGDNVMEGVVIRPWEVNLNLPNGAHFVLKNKNAKFSEQSFGVPKKPKAPLGGLDKALFQAVAAFITHNRLMAVISKEKELTQKDFGRIMGLLTRDAIEEYEEDINLCGNTTDYSVKDGLEDWVQVSKELQGVATLVVRDYWVQEF